MPKDWLCDRGGSGSERRAEPQRHVVDELASFLCVRARVYLYYMPKDSLGARKGLMTNWPHHIMMEVSAFNCRTLSWVRSYHNAKSQIQPTTNAGGLAGPHEATVEEEHRKLDGPEREPGQHAIGKEDLDDGEEIREDSCILRLESLEASVTRYNGGMMTT